MVKEAELIKQAWEGSRGYFDTLCRARSHRIGLGKYTTSGQEDCTPITDKKRTSPEGFLPWTGQSSAVPLAEWEKALLFWAHMGPTGYAMGDIDNYQGGPTMLNYQGFASPRPCNDMNWHQLILFDDEGAWYMKQPMAREKPVEIEGGNDYEKIWNWYKNAKVKIKDKKDLDVDWGVPAKLMGQWMQWNWGQPGQLIFWPFCDCSREYINFMATAMLNCGWYLTDDRTKEPCGTAEWVRPGMLETPFTIWQYEEVVKDLMPVSTAIGIMNVRAACAALGLGCSMFGAWSQPMFAGGFPDFAKGLGFKVEMIDGADVGDRPSARILGLPGNLTDGFFRPWIEDPFEAARLAIVDSKYKGGGPYDPGDNWILKNKGPYKPETVKTFNENPTSKYPDWVIEAVGTTIKYLYDNYGRAPVNYGPISGQMQIIVHHVDCDFYDKFYVDGVTTQEVRDHLKKFHGNGG